MFMPAIASPNNTAATHCGRATTATAVAAARATAARLDSRAAAA